MKSYQELAIEARLELAMNLLDRAASRLEYGVSNDTNWFREYFLLTGQHMILTDEGWESGDSKAGYLSEDPNWKPLEEVNEPQV